MFGTGMVRGVQAHVAGHVVGFAVAVEVSAREGGPPTGARGGEAGAFGPVGEALALVVVEVLYLAPLEGDEEIRPAVAVGVAPEGGADHADVLQPGREC